MLLFHGTTVANAKSILKHGFNYNVDPIWTCSNQETYFFHEDFLTKEFPDLESKKEIMSRGIHMALDQSLITLAIQNPSDYRGAVLVFDTELMNNKNDIEEDYSCEGMSDLAVCLRNPDMSGLIGVYVMDQDLRSLRLLTLASLSGRDWIMKVDLPEWEQKIVDALSESHVDTSEVIDNVTYTKMRIKKSINPGLMKAA